ncbi:MAG: phosphatidylinositol mannoside acyltransferase, partial [Actinomycetes bacterium]
LARVVPEADPDELRRLSRAGMRSYLRYWREVFRLPELDPEQIHRVFVMHDDGPLRQALAHGGAVAALGHMGNWDHAGAWGRLELGPLTTVAERLRPESLFDRFVAFRQSLGLEILPLTGGDQEVFGTLVRRVREGHLVPLLADRDLTEHGVPVTFFGERTSMPAGPAALALAAGAPLFPVSIWYERDRTIGRVHPAVDVPASGSRRERIATITQQVADVLAGAISEHPMDWHMLARLWWADLDRPSSSPPAGHGSAP